MSIDPFATENTESSTPEETTTTNPVTEKKETPVSTADQSKIVVTLKGGTGYDAPWIVVHADDADDALSALSQESMRDLIEKTATVGKFFASKGGGSQKSSGKPAGATQAPNGQVPPEGYVYKSGIGKNGKPWQAFMAKDRNSGLEPIWL